MRDKVMALKSRWSTKISFILVCAAITLVAGGVFAYNARPNAATFNTDKVETGNEPELRKSDTSQITNAAISQDAPTESGTVTKPQPSGSQTSVSNTVTPKSVAKQTGVKPVEFSISPSNVTVQSGGVTPRITVSSTNGQPLAFLQLTGSNFKSNEGSIFKNAVLSHTYTFEAMPSLKPGIYTIEIMGYLPRGQEVRKPITITVTQGPTFKLSALQPDYNSDTEDTFYVPFNIDSYLGNPNSVKTTATIISNNGIPMSVTGIQDMFNTYGYRRQVGIYDNGYATGRIIVRVTATDGINTNTLDIPYDVLGE